MDKMQATTIILVIITASLSLLLVNASISDEGYQRGYTQGVADGVGHGYNIRDPTYQEMIDFLAVDQTDKNTYNEKTYSCQNFVNDVINNAFAKGIRAGYVWIEYPVSAHGIICFQTIDKGLVFVEPQSDNVVALTVGQHFLDRELYETPDYDDTVIRYGIIW